MSIDLNDLRRTGGIIKLSGKEYVTFSGLLVTAHASGLRSITPKLLSWADGAAVFSATAEGERGTYTAHGDADPTNVKRGMQGAVLRMAETRAVCRALRMYLGIGMTAREELPGDEPNERSRQSKSAPLQAFCAEVEKLGASWEALEALHHREGWEEWGRWDHPELRQLYSAIRGGAYPSVYKPAGGEG